MFSRVAQRFQRFFACCPPRVARIARWMFQGLQGLLRFQGSPGMSGFLLRCQLAEMTVCPLYGPSTPRKSGMINGTLENCRKRAGKWQESATFLQRSFFNVACRNRPRFSVGFVLVAKQDRPQQVAGKWQESGRKAPLPCNAAS